MCFIGDFCGKTCIIHRHLHDEFPFATYSRTIFEEYASNIFVDGKNFSLESRDTSNLFDDYERIRPMLYPNSDVIVIVFDISGDDYVRYFRAKVEGDESNVTEYWAPEVKHFLKDVHIILVGNKLDLKCQKETVTYSQGL